MTTEGDLEGRVRQLLPESLRQAGAGESLRDHGLDSMQLLLLLDALETCFGIEFEDRDFADANFENIESMITLVREIQTRHG